MGLFGTNLFEIFNCDFVPTFCDFVKYLWLILENSSFKNLWRIHFLFGKTVCCSRIHFSLTKSVNKLSSTKNHVFITWMDDSETGNSQLIYIWLTNGTFKLKVDNFFLNCLTLYDVMQEIIKNLVFVQCVNFEFKDFLKNSGTKYLLIFENSSEEIWDSKAFVSFALAGRHRRLRTIYIKQNLFHQSKLGRDVEPQNTHIVLFKSPRGVMQVSTFSAQLGLWSELIDWYWDATSVLYGPFIDWLVATHRPSPTLV